MGIKDKIRKIIVESEKVPDYYRRKDLGLFVRCCNPHSIIPTSIDDVVRLNKNGGNHAMFCYCNSDGTKYRDIASGKLFSEIDNYLTDEKGKYYMPVSLQPGSFNKNDKDKGNIIFSTNQAMPLDKSEVAMFSFFDKSILETERQYNEVRYILKNPENVEEISELNAFAGFGDDEILDKKTILGINTTLNCLIDDARLVSYNYYGKNKNPKGIIEEKDREF